MKKHLLIPTCTDLNSLWCKLVFAFFQLKRRMARRISGSGQSALPSRDESRSPRLGISATALAVLVFTTPVQAHVSRLVIDSRKVLEAKGGPDGAIAYEVLNGHFEGALNPDDAHNRIITDLGAAPLDTLGEVTYSSNFTIIKPVDMSQSTGVLYDMIPNRGNGEAIVPDPFGHIHVITGWQGDIAPKDGLYTAQVPVARHKNGAAITGPVFVRFVDMKDGATTLPLIGGLGAGVARPAPVSLDTRKARLFSQAGDQSPQVAISNKDWAIADCSQLPFPGTPDPMKICLKGGFNARLSYGLTYTGKDPLVLGIGFAAIRDLASFLRYNQSGANPLAGHIKWAITTGTSQSGNFVRSFIHLGFNADEQGRIVFDGANPNIAARMVPLNIRFGVPGGAANQYELGSEGILWWSSYEDKARGLKKASLLDRCTESRTCPKIIETFGATEIWNLRMSPDLVGSDAKADIPLPDNVRRYYFPGVTHGGAPEDATGGFSTTGQHNPYLACTLPDNPNPSLPLWRASVADLIDWVRDGVEPPASLYPTLAAGDLVAPTAQAMGMPDLPGGAKPDGLVNVFVQQDAGAGFIPADLSGAPSRMPPKIVRALPTLVPRVNGDGNETAGVLSVQMRVPLGTYTGWNAHANGYDKGKYCLFLGGFIPFAQTKAERIANNDPRPSLEERYGTHDAFVAEVKAAADDLTGQRRLLPADAQKIVTAAEKSEVLR